ncbi:MAG: toll/interleukin-1 receptor domain-containing protein [Gemmatimonas sp.]
MPDQSIFLSYRREDTAGETGRLAEHLERQFGANRVFFDIDAIAPGTDFVGALDQALDSTAVVLVLIGRRWLTATNADGTRRIDDPNDFVHREIAKSLERDARVIPVLLQNVSMPSAAELPPALASLATRQAMSIQHEEFGDDAKRLANAIAPFLGTPSKVESAGTPAGSKRRALVGLAVGALLVLVFAAVRWQRASTGAASVAATADSAKRSRQQLVDDLVKVAAQQGERQQFAEALATLDRAVVTDADVQRARTLQEDLAMRWIRALKVGEGQTFTDAMTVPLAVLDRAAPFAKNARQGDLLAHLGWAMFLRWRDRNGSPSPVDAYTRALAADSTNPFANAMLAHWILSYEDGPEAASRARQHFRIAADAGRELTEVRRLQLAALNNDRSVESRLETLRVLNEMRMRSEPRPPSVNDAWSIYYFALSGQASLTWSDLIKVLPPVEHLRTYRWAFSDHAQRDKNSGQQFRFYVARLGAAAGDTAAAADSLRALRSELAKGAGTLRDAVDAALAELAPRKPG